MRLDLQGRLLAFEAVPREFEPFAETAAPPDWTPLFSAADLDPAQFHPTEPQWTPVVACDFRVAWIGVWPEAREVPIRLEAAAWHGKLAAAIRFRTHLDSVNSTPNRPILGSLEVAWKRASLASAAIRGGDQTCHGHFRKGRRTSQF